MITVPIRTGRGQNQREHHFVRAKRVRAEREAVAWLLKGQRKPALPCRVTLTRVSPAKGKLLDDDNCSGALKAARDQVAEWLGVDDGDKQRVAYAYAQKRGAWAVEIEFSPMESET